MTFRQLLTLSVINNLTSFTALHGMQTRSSDENSVCPSVRLSVCLSNACIVTKRKKDLSRFLYRTKDHLT